MTGGWAARHASGAELVRSLTRAGRVDATHVRTVVAHVQDRRGVLEALLDPSVLADWVGVDITGDASTVEAFACQLAGTSFHALTFSLRPSADGPFPTTSVLTPVPTGPLALPDTVRSRPVAEVFGGARLATYDTARRSTSVFDGTTIEEFLLELPGAAPPAEPGAGLSFREIAAQVTELTTRMKLPLSFLHAPVAAATAPGVARGVTGRCLRFGVAFAPFDDSGRLTFGTRLVALCSENGYAMWERATGREATYDYWDAVVPLPRAGAAGSGRGPGASAGGRPAAGTALAVTCVGPARPGTTDAVLQVLERAGAPLIGLSETALDDIAVIHLLTRTPRSPVPPDDDLGRRADEALQRALGATGTDLVLDDRLRDYRALVSPRAERRTDSGLAALWLGWTTPVAAHALELTVRTLGAALDDIAGRYGSPDRRPLDGHLNIEYLVCREIPWAHRLHGRMRLAVDLDALGVRRGEDEDRLGRFCSDVERLWRTSLSFALGTAHVELEVVWRESWLGRWATLRATAQDLD